MSDKLDFVTPSKPATQITVEDLAALGKDEVNRWATAGLWTLEQALAVLNGFVPLDSWEPDYEAKSWLMGVQTAPLKGEMQRQSAEPLPAKLPPKQWLKMAEECGKVFAPIKAALSKGKPLSAKPKAKMKEAIQTYVNERRDDIAQRQWQNFANGIKPTKPTKGTVANELLDDINKNFGKKYKDEQNVSRMYLVGWDLPNPE